jgi:FkbM family methyltransferase
VYSQCGEDDIVLGIFGSYVGRFLDIGAHDGTYLSNTLALVERAWSGVLVEANPLTFSRLYERHGMNPKLTLVNAAVGLEWKLTKFWPATKDDGLSTTEATQRESREAEAAYGEPYRVAMLPVSKLEEYGPFDFVSIDTEGTSVDLLFSLRWVLPKVICVEHDGRIQHCIDWAVFQGYHLAHQNSINLIFEKRP